MLIVSNIYIFIGKIRQVKLVNQIGVDNLRLSKDFNTPLIVGIYPGENLHCYYLADFSNCAVKYVDIVERKCTDTYRGNSFEEYFPESQSYS